MGRRGAAARRINLLQVVELLQTHITPAPCQAVFGRVRRTERQRRSMLISLWRRPAEPEGVVLAGRRMVEEPDRGLLSHSHRGGHVSRGHTREFGCEVVSETVLIRLRRSSGFGRPQAYFIQCNQTECQYVDENKSPCPLHVGMFAEEIRVAEEARRRRAE